MVEDPAAEPGDIAACGVEAKLEHSKTGFSRYLNMAGTTKGVGIEVAMYFAEYWRLAGFRLSTSMQNGLRVTRPDFWVLRVSLLGLSETQLEAMLAWSGTCGIGPIVYGMKSLGVGAAARGGATRREGRRARRRSTSTSWGVTAPAQIWHEARWSWRRKGTR